MLYQQTTLNCQGKILDLSQPKVMGILNLSPDSFYDGGKYLEDKKILKRVEKMLLEGADMIDVGGMSSRPGANIIDVQEEIKRVVPKVKMIMDTFPDLILSIDTIRSEVARHSYEEGASIINDISAGSIDANMFKTIAELNCPYILMHMQGTPQAMQEAPQYDEVITDVLSFLIEKIGTLRQLGVKDIVIDPGFGFGKTIDHNYALLRNLHCFKILEIPILVGLSRKSMIYKLLNTRPQEALNGTSVLHFSALQNGAKILRVHDVKEAKETIQLWEKIENTALLGE